MSKAFTKEDEGGESPPLIDYFPTLSPEVPNRITKRGYEAFVEEIARLADASEPADQRRAAALRDRLRTWVVTEDSYVLPNFGRCVRVKALESPESIRQFTIVGIDEVSPAKLHISWLSPMGRALIRAAVGDVISITAPNGTHEYEVLHVGF